MVVLRRTFSVVVLKRPTLRRKLKDKRRRIFTRRLEEEKGCLLEEVIGKYRWDLGISKVHLLLRWRFCHIWKFNVLCRWRKYRR